MGGAFRNFGRTSDGDGRAYLHHHLRSATDSVGSLPGDRCETCSQLMTSLNLQYSFYTVIS